MLCIPSNTYIHLLLSFGTCNCGPDHYRELGTNRPREETSSILQQHQAKQLVRTSHIFSYVWLCTLEQNKVQISLIIVRSILFSHHHLLLDNFEKKGSSLRIIEQKMLYLSQIPIWWVVSLSLSLYVGMIIMIVTLELFHKLCCVFLFVFHLEDMMMMNANQIIVSWNFFYPSGIAPYWTNPQVDVYTSRK